MEQTLEAKAKSVGHTHDKDFAQSILKSQGTKEDFKNVSQIWLKKTLSMDEALVTLEKSAEGTRDVGVYSHSNLTFNPNGTLEVNGEAFNFSFNSLRSLAGAAKVPADFLERLHEGDSKDRELYSRVLENGFRNKAQKNFMLRIRGNTIRALVSEKYMCIDNVWYMKALKDFIPGGRVSHFQSDKDTMSFSILIPDSVRRESDSEYGGGIQGKNSEISTGCMVSNPYIFRAICMNGCIWGKYEGVAYRQIHFGNKDLSKIYEELGLNIQKQIPLFSEALEFLLSLKELTCPETVTIPAIIDLARANKLTQRNTVGWLVGLGSERMDSAFGVIQGLTRWSQTRGSVEQEQLEGLAGKLTGMKEDEWSKVFERAELLDESIVDETMSAYQQYVSTERKRTVQPFKASTPSV